VAIHGILDIHYLCEYLCILNITINLDVSVTNIGLLLSQVTVFCAYIVNLWWMHSHSILTPSLSNT
jgi:hypothetical protein